MSLAEIAAFHVLGDMNPGDQEAIATYWLEQGFEGENIVCIAFPDISDRSKLSVDFDKALVEAGVSRQLSLKEGAWIAIRYYLGKIIESPDFAIDALRTFIGFYNKWGDIELFERPDCDVHFEERKKKYAYAGKKFAAQEWGIEKLYGIYYSSDDWSYGWDGSSLPYDEWLESRKEDQKQGAVSEAKRVLEKFYRLESDLPDNLKNLSQLMK